MAMPMQQYAQPVTAYIQTTGALQKMAQDKAAGEQAARFNSLRMQGMQQDMDLGRRQAEQKLSLGEIGMRQAQEERRDRHLLEMAKAAAWADTPEKWEQSLDFFERSGFDVSQFRGKPELRGMVMQLGHPQTRPQALSQFEKLLRARGAAPEGSYERKMLDAKLSKETSSSGTRIRFDESGNPIVEMGGAATTQLDRPNVRESQEKIIAAGESLRRLKRIKDLYDPSFLTYWGKAGKTLSSIKSKAGMGLGDDERKALRQHRKFSQAVNTEFNAYRKLITGAAAAMAELKDLKKAMISTDVGPEEFEASFNEYSGELSRTLRIRNKLLREGIKPGTKQFGERLDRLYLSGDDDSMEARGDELEGQGKKPEEIVQILEQEGYI